jgi:hypothetical protein
MLILLLLVLALAEFETAILLVFHGLSLGFDRNMTVCISASIW